MLNVAEGREQSLIERLRRLEMENKDLRLKLWRLNRKPSRIFSYVMLLLGALLLALSILYSSLIPAFIGLGLTFWGALLIYIRPVRFVKSVLLDSSVIPLLLTVSKIISDLNLKGKAIYLPPRSLREIKAGTVFIPSKREVIIPPVEEVAEGRVFLRNPNGICLSPPGLGLTNLYEEELGREFAGADLAYLQNNLPALFIEGLEIAEDIEINIENDTIHVKIEGSAYADICRELRDTAPEICMSIGCPLCSSIALALTRVTDKPIIIEKTERSEDGETVEVYYRILER